MIFEIKLIGQVMFAYINPILILLTKQQYTSFDFSLFMGGTDEDVLYLQNPLDAYIAILDSLSGLRFVESMVRK